jgi:hypothetical protein
VGLQLGDTDRRQPGPGPGHGRRHPQAQAHLNYEVTIPRWGFELMRLGAWFVVFQVTFFVFLVVPLVVIRAMTGSDSPYIP